MALRVLKQRKPNQEGFTLIEIIIAMVLIGLMASFVIGNSFIASRRRGRDTERKASLNNLSKALELYINDRGVYPSSNASGQILGCGSTATPVACDWGQPWTNSDGTSYMTFLPEDPQDHHTYYYVSNGTAWQAYAFIESVDDPDLDRNGDGDYVPAEDDFSYSCGANNCNFGMSSGNTRPGEALP